MKKILFLIDTVDVGGATKLTFDVIKKLDKSKFEPAILYLNIPQFGEKDLLNYYKFEDFSNLLWYNKFRVFKRIIYLYKNLRKYDMVHSCMEQSNFYSTFVKFLPFSDFKLVITYHGLDSVYNIDDSKIKVNISPFYKFLMKDLQNILFKNVNSIIGVCHEIKNYLVRDRKINPEKIDVIYHGINFNYLDNIKKKSPENNSILKEGHEKSFKIGYIGRLGYSKGLEGFTENLKILKKKIKDLKVLIKGEGELEDFIRRKINEDDLGQFVTLEKFDKNVFSFYKRIDLMVLPSFFETTNLTVLEAMYSGTNVLASDTGGIPEIIENNVNGFLFKKGDFKDMVDQIIKIYNLNPKVLNEIQKNAFETVKEKFDLDKNILQIQENFIRVINNY